MTGSDEPSASILDETLMAAALRDEATTLLGILEDSCARREGTIISKLVQSHISGRLTDLEARSGIAGISELRKLLSDLRRTVGVGSRPGSSPVV